jgi:hypothetical protein
VKDAIYIVNGISEKNMQVTIDGSLATYAVTENEVLTAGLFGRLVIESRKHNNVLNLDILVPTDRLMTDRTLLEGNGFVWAGSLQTNVDGRAVLFIRFRTCVKSAGDGLVITHNTTLPPTDMERQAIERMRREMSKPVDEAPAVVFAKAVIALRDREAGKKAARPDSNEQRYIPDTRSAEEKLREAKQLTRQAGLVPRQSAVADTCRNAEENLRSQPRSIVGSPDAIPHREQITPVFVGDLFATPKGISGGIDFSPWVK